MEENENYFESYDFVSDDLQYVTKSLVRLKILTVLSYNSENMKGISQKTGLSYSSISANMHKLESRGFLYRESNRYFLTNSTKLQIGILLRFKDVVNLVNEIFNLLDKHRIDRIPKSSVEELYMLNEATLLETDEVDVYRVYNFIEDSLQNANCAKCVLPFFYDGFNKKLNDLADMKKSVEVFVPSNLLSAFMKNSKIKNMSTFKCENNFLLIFTDNVMIFGLFRDDGFFDQNRLLTSQNSDSIRWAQNLFENFKKLNK